MKKTHVTTPNELGLQNFLPWHFEEAMKCHELFKQHNQANFQLPHTPKPLKISCSKFFKENRIPPNMKENIVDMELINKVSGIRREVFGDVDMIEIDRISGIKHRPSSPQQKEVPVRPEINRSCEDMLEKIFEELSERDRDKKSVSSESDTMTIKTFDSMEDEHKHTQLEESEVLKDLSKNVMAPPISKEESEFLEQFPKANSLASFIAKEESGKMKKFPSTDSMASSISEKTAIPLTAGMTAYTPRASTPTSMIETNKSTLSTPSGMQTHSRTGNDATVMTEKTTSFDQQTQTEIIIPSRKGIKSFCQRLFKKNGKNKKISN